MGGEAARGGGPGCTCTFIAPHRPNMIWRGVTQLICLRAGGGLEKGSREWKRQQRRQTAVRALEILANIEPSPLMPQVRSPAQL
jgi:hypothetical protein